MSDVTEHWDEIYSTRSTTEVSWFQREPVVSLRLIEANSTPASAIIDIGAGASFLVDRLLAKHYRDVTVLDVSRAALEGVLSRVGTKKGLHAVVANVVDWAPARTYDLWHDRAVFHFLTRSLDQQRYVARAASALKPGGTLVLGVFALDGPTQCSGLAVQRYGVEEISATFASAFTLEASEREEHHTPGGAVQAFTWATLRRRES